jgi:hypothetical protein
MPLFLGTLIIMLVCCLAMAVGLLLRGKPLAGGCGHHPEGLGRCATCPNRAAGAPRRCNERGDS